MINQVLDCFFKEPIFWLSSTLVGKQEKALTYLHIYASDIECLESKRKGFVAFIEFIICWYL